MPEGASAGSLVLAANTFDIVGRHDEAARLLKGAPETPLTVFARWLLARDAAKEHARAYFAADPVRHDEAVLFWMKYDCHHFAELDDKARLARLMNAVAESGGPIAQFWPATRVIEFPPLKGEGRIGPSEARPNSGRGHGTDPHPARSARADLPLSGGGRKMVVVQAVAIVRRARHALHARSLIVEHDRARHRAGISASAVSVAGAQVQPASLPLRALDRFAGHVSVARWIDFRVH